MNLNTALGIIRRQRNTVMATVAIVLSLVLAYLLTATPLYQAEVLIQVDGRSSNLLDPTATGDEQSAVLNARVDGEVVILSSEATALAVVKQTGLIRDKEFGPQLGWFEKLGMAFGTKLDGNSIRRFFGLAPRLADDQERLVKVTLKKLQNAVDVRRRNFSYLIEIAVTSQDPARSAELANAYAAVYIERQVNAKIQSTIFARNVLRRQVQTAQDQLAKSETAINDFIESNLSRLSRETKDPAIGNLWSRLNESKSLQAERKAAVALATSALKSGDWGTVATSLGDEAVKELARQRQELETQLRQVEAAGGKTVNLQERLAALDAELTTKSSSTLLQIEEEMRSLSGRESQARDQLRTALLNSDMSAEMLAELYNLQQSSTVARSQYQTLLAREQDLAALANLQIADARVVSEALPPLSAAFPNWRRIGVGAVVAALGLAVLLAFLREFYVGGIVATSQLSNIIQAKVPVSIGFIRGMSAGTDPADVVVTAPMSFYAETFRKLRAAIDIAFETKDGMQQETKQRGRVILVCSAIKAEGKSMTAIALGRTYALAGVKTLLIDADMRNPSVGKRLRLPIRSGLIDFISAGDGSDFSQLREQTDPLSPLVVITAGVRSPKPTDQLLNGSAFKFMISAVTDVFDIVIIDSPPILPVVDTRYLARYADVIVQVVRYGTTTQGEVREAVAQMREHQHEGTHYLGVLNLEEFGGLRYGYYGHYGYYGKETKDDERQPITVES